MNINNKKLRKIGEKIAGSFFTQSTDIAFFRPPYVRYLFVVVDLRFQTREFSKPHKKNKKWETKLQNLSKIMRQK